MITAIISALAGAFSVSVSALLSVYLTALAAGQNAFQAVLDFVSSLV